MSKLFTGKGDDGSTGLLGDERVLKSDLRIEVNGTLDELNSFLGLAKAQVHTEAVHAVVEVIQKDLYSVMADIANVDQSKRINTSFDPKRVDSLERSIEAFAKDTEFPKGFILPGETETSAVFGVCRTIARRAERRVVELNEKEPLDPAILKYMNRLSSLLFLFEVKFSTQNKNQFHYAKEIS